MELVRLRLLFFVSTPCPVPQWCCDICRSFGDAWRGKSDHRPFFAGCLDNEMSNAGWDGGLLEERHLAWPAWRVRRMAKGRARIPVRTVVV
jgi:hypothetical protein